MRSRHRMWRNGPGGRWNVRLIWYHETPGVDIRLEINDRGRETNLYPVSEDQANDWWLLAIKLSELGPFTSKLLETIEQKQKEHMPCQPASPTKGMSIPFASTP